MAIYINPTDGQTKEEWLNKHAAMKSGNKSLVHRYDELRSNGLITVCLIDNTDFTAAALEVSKDDAKSLSKFDGRPKLWFAVPVKALVNNSGIAKSVVDSLLSN